MDNEYDNLVIDRILLINSIKDGTESWDDETYKEYFSKILDFIKKDQSDHFLTLSQDEFGKVSYSKNKENMFNSDKRTKLTLRRYIEKYCLPNLGIEHVDKKVIDQFCFSVENIITEKVNFFRKINGILLSKMNENATYYKNGGMKEERVVNGNLEKIISFYETSDSKEIIKNIKYLKDGKLSDPFKNCCAETSFNKDGSVSDCSSFNNGIISKTISYYNDNEFKEVITSYFVNNKVSDILLENYKNNVIFSCSNIDCNDNVKAEDVYYSNGTIKTIIINYYDDNIKLVVSYHESSNIKSIEYFDEKNRLHRTDGPASIIHNDDKFNKEASRNFYSHGKLLNTKIKVEAKKAGYRVIANQTSKVVKNSIISLMKDNGSHKTKLNYIKTLLDSEVGLALISTMMGHVLTQSKYSENEQIDKIAKEFRIEGMTIAGNVAIDEIMKYIVPTIKDVINTIPEEKCRIEENSNQEDIAESSYYEGNLKEHNA